MKITGIKLIKNGAAGIEVEGIDLVSSGNERAMFKDDVKRTRRFPLSLQLRNAINVLNYPFLVGTEHWKPEFAQRMKDDFSGPNYKDGDPTEKLFKTVTSFWQSTQITRVTMEKGNYKLAGEIACQMCTVKATVSVAPDCDHSLYSYVQDALNHIVELVDQTLNLPQLAIGSPEEMRAIYSQISKNEDDYIPEDADPNEAFLQLMQTAGKKGFGIVLDDNMLAQLAEHTDEEDNEDDTIKNGDTFQFEDQQATVIRNPAMFADPNEMDIQAQEQFKKDLAIEELSGRDQSRQEMIQKVVEGKTGDEAELKSLETKDEGIFKDAEEHLENIEDLDS